MTTPTHTPAEEKAALRALLKTHRETLASAAPDAGNAVADRFPERLLQRFGPRVSTYLPIGSELDTAALNRRLRRLKAELCLPRLEADGGMTFRSWQAGDSLEAGPFGLAQPAETARRVSPTLVLTPLLAFDIKGNRLGYGKGHYDRTLAALRENGRVFVCGLAYAGQQVPTVPGEPTDIPLDWVVTEDGSIPLFFGRAAGQG